MHNGSFLSFRALILLNLIRLTHAMLVSLVWTQASGVITLSHKTPGPISELKKKKQRLQHNGFHEAR